MGNRYPEGQSRIWAADTGCFAHPHTFRLDKYLAWLWRNLPYVEWCLFATAPDVFGDGQETLHRAIPALPAIRFLGYKAALVLQPGIMISDICWDALDAVFLGGPNEWQHSQEAQNIMREARNQQKHIHIGRVNSMKRFRYAQAFADSADGTHVAFKPTKGIAEVAEWMNTVQRQPMLDL